MWRQHLHVWSHVLISCTGRDVHDTLLFQKYLKDIKFRQLEPGLERLRCKSALSCSFAGAFWHGQNREKNTLTCSLIKLLRSMGVRGAWGRCMHICKYIRSMYACVEVPYFTAVGCLLDHYLRVRQTRVSFLWMKGLFHLEQKHCQKGKHAVGRTSEMAPIHQCGSIALHCSSTWKSSLFVFLQPPPA